MRPEDVAEVKKEIRERIWRLLEEKGVALFPKPIRGRIPNFRGREAAARRLVRHPVFEQARVVFVCPDSPQRPVREAALRAGKVLIMATPRLREGFLVLNPREIPPRLYGRASTIRGAFELGRLVEVPPLKIDVKVTGSVAVSPEGGRVGKGGGYSDLEYAILRELGLIDGSTPVVTTVHDLQVVKWIPMARHDMPVDCIFTPTRTIRTNTKYPKPPGILWDELKPSKVAEIPILRRLAKERGVKIGNIV